MYKHEYTKRLEFTLITKLCEFDYIEKCCNYADKLIDKNLPVIFDEKHLVDILQLDGIDKNAYHIFCIDKKNGEKRNIASPSMNIKYRQQWILRNILDKIDMLDSVHGFVKGRSIVTNALEHVGKECILNIDIADFFPSISKNKVIRTFENIGYCKKVATLLADICCFKESLPQGAPTSPSLANIVFSEVDDEILKFIKNKGINYTRYADDLTFSSNEDLFYLVEVIYGILERYDYKPNKNKTNIVSGNKRKMVTGIIVNDKIKVPKRFKNKLRTGNILL